MCGKILFEKIVYIYIPGVPAPSFVGYEAYELSLKISIS